MDYILGIINTYGMEIIGTILTTLAGIVAMAIKRLATKYINTKVKREIALTVVQGVEQLYKHLSGEEKLAQALEAAADMLAANGITVTDLELRMLLEAAVGEFNDVFNTVSILDGVAIEDLTDEQLREVAVQAGLSRSYVESLTREMLETALEGLADNEPQA